MMHTFSYKSGFIHVHETVANGVSEIRWQFGRKHGRAHSVHGAKCAITRQERASNQKGEG